MSKEKPSKRRIVQAVLDYLSRNRLMAFGTSVNNRPWTATVFFAFDEHFRLFFFSQPGTRHCRNIEKNPRVAVTMHQYHGEPNAVRGIQIAGKARRVSRPEYRRAYALYKKRFPWADEFRDNHELYIITPTEIHYLDQKLFGHFYRVRIS